MTPARTKRSTMDKKQDLLQTYKKRMIATAIVSSVGFGVMIGAGAAFLTAFLCWLLSFGSIWITVGIGIGAALVSGVLLYFLRLRPTEQDVVRQIDRMGLEERAVTMAELRDVDTPMARLQRSDATTQIGGVSPRQVKKTFRLYTLPKGASAALGILLVAAIVMTTVTGLTQAGIIPDPGIVTPEQEKFVTVSYLVEEGGEIEGEADQILTSGEDATPVVAVAEDGWTFVRWSDGGKTTQRTDRGITADLTVTAIFEEIGEDGDGDEDGSISDDVEGDYDQNAPDPDENDGSGASGDGGGGGEGDGDGSTGAGSGEGSAGHDGEGQGDGQGEGAGGGWSDSNQIIDGSTDYRDVFDTYYDMAMEIIKNGGELPQELREFIEKYFGSL